jgi:hypothetical protein
MGTGVVTRLLGCMAIVALAYPAGRGSRTETAIERALYGVEPAPGGFQASNPALRRSERHGYGGPGAGGFGPEETLEKLAMQ